jgi:hypothetical protein
MDVQHNITGIPAADSYRLEIKYYTAGDQEPVSLYLYNFSTGSWENKETCRWEVPQPIPNSSLRNSRARTSPAGRCACASCRRTTTTPRLA